MTREPLLVEAAAVWVVRSNLLSKAEGTKPTNSNAALQKSYLGYNFVFGARMKKLLLAVLLFCVPAFAQFVPQPAGSYVNSGSGWVAATSTSTLDAATFVPKPIALYRLNTTLNQWVPWDGGSGSAGSVTTFPQGNQTPLFTTSVATPSSTPALSFTLSNQIANCVFGNFSSTSAPPSCSASPIFSAAGLTNFPTGQFANAGTVSSVTRGLNFEYHFQEASGATAITDYSGAGNTGTVTGTVGLTGTLVGGMNVCSTGCVGNVAPSGYVSLPATINTDPTLQFYTCTNQLTSAGITGGFIDMVFGGLISATVPSSGTTQATGLMLAGAQGNSLSTNAASISKYAIAPGTFNNATVTAQSIDSAGGCHLITVVRNTAPTPDILYVDGKAASGYQITGTGTLQQAIIGVLAIGTPPYATLSATYKHPYPIYYAAGFNRALTAEEVQRSYGSIQSWMGFRGVVQLPPVYSD